MYSKQLREHFFNPQNQGELEPPASVADARFPLCGDWLRLFIRVENDQVVETLYQAVGCAAALAAGSAGTELIRGASVAQARQLTADELERAPGGVPEAKRHALDMFLSCLNQALDDAEASLETLPRKRNQKSTRGCGCGSGAPSSPQPPHRAANHRTAPRPSRPNPGSTGRERQEKQ